MRTWEHTRSQLLGVPRAKSSVHESVSAQEAGQAPSLPAVIPGSQASLASSTPLPQMAPQSESLAALHPAPSGQHPSPFTQEVMACRTQGMLQAEVEPGAMT